MPAYVKVAKSSELGPGTAKLVEAGSKKIALFNVEGSLHAIDDTRTHRGGPLSEGMLVGNEVTCPRARRRLRKTRAIFRQIMREIGRKGGKICGKRSLETMTPEERTARAKKASQAAAKKRTAARLARERAGRGTAPRAKSPRAGK